MKGKDYWREENKRDGGSTIQGREREKEGNRRKEEEGEVEIAYINVNRSTVTIQTVLETSTSHIIIAAEPWIYRRKGIPPATVSHPKYTIINHIHHDTYLVCYARKDINATANVNRYIAHISVETKDRANPVKATAVYLPPDMETTTYTREIQKVFKPHINTVLGDFNAHNEAWSIQGQKNNAKGNALRELTNEKTFTCMNPHTITRQQGTSKSCLDLVWEKASQGSRIIIPPPEWHGSDHALIKTRITNTHKPSLKIYKTTDWNKWQEWLDTEAADEKEHLYEEFGSAYKELVKKCAKWSIQKTACAQSKKWWDKECKTEWLKVKRAGRRNAKSYNIMSKRYKRMIKRKKEECWNKFIQQNDHHHPWRIINLTRDPFRLREQMGEELQDKEGKILKQDKEKVEGFQEHNFIWAPQQEAITPQDSYIQEELDDTPLIWREEQVDRALTGTKNNSAPGPDGISYRLLKMIRQTTLGKAIIRDIARCFPNNEQQREDIPETWQQMLTVMIPKPGKDHTLVKGWRPIVLSNTVGKLAEKVFADELQKIALFHQLQFGSRKKKSAIDAMMIAVAKAQEAVERGDYVTILGDDVVSAFNHTRKGKIIDRLNEKKGRKWIPMIQNWFRERNIPIWWDGKPRGQVKMTQGTPQGSPLSPVLWLIYYSAILQEMEDTKSENDKRQQSHQRYHLRSGDNNKKNLHTRNTEDNLSYVDDLFSVLVTKGYLSPTTHEKVIQEHQERRKTVHKKNDLELDKEKSWRLDIGTKGKKEFRESQKNLGIHLDWKLNFKKHLSERIDKAEKVLYRLKPILKQNGDISPKTRRQVYTNLIRPIATWGGELYFQDHPSKQNWHVNELRKLEYKCLRDITRSSYGSRKTILNNIANIEDIEIKLRDMQLRWAARAIQNNTGVIKDMYNCVPKNKRDPHDMNKNWLQNENDGYNNVIHRAFSRTESEKHTLSWGEYEAGMVTSYPNAIIDIEVLIEPATEASKQLTHWVSELGRIKEEGFFPVYTDGSGKEDRAASAIYAPYAEPLLQKATEYLGKKALVPDSELNAINMALHEHRNEPELWILTDSLSSIQLIRELTTPTSTRKPHNAIERTLVYRLSGRTIENKSTRISWVRSHLEIRGNEMADRAAQKTAEEGKGSPDTKVTPRGLIAWGKRRRAKARYREGYGKDLTQELDNKQISAYTWCRTNRGPLRGWRHRTGQLEQGTGTCNLCHRAIQTGEHMMWQCRSLTTARRKMGKQNWEDFDKADKECKASYLDTLYNLIIKSAGMNPHPDPHPKKKRKRGGIEEEEEE